MKRVPSFSARPGFPSGLQVSLMQRRSLESVRQQLTEFSDFVQVLLVETDKQSREKVSKQLKQLSYVGEDEYRIVSALSRGPAWPTERP